MELPETLLGHGSNVLAPDEVEHGQSAFGGPHPDMDGLLLVFLGDRKNNDQAGGAMIEFVDGNNQGRARTSLFAA